MDVGFNDQRGKLVWTLPPETAEALAQTPQDKQSQVTEVLQNSLGIVVMFLIKAMGGDQRIAQHLEGVMNVMGDLLQASAQRQQEQ